jgi:hypothetical protein
MVAAAAAVDDLGAQEGTSSSHGRSRPYARGDDEYALGGMSSMTCYTGAPRHEYITAAHAVCPGMGAVSGLGHGLAPALPLPMSAGPERSATASRGGCWGGSGGAGVSDLVGAVAMAAAAAEASAASRLSHLNPTTRSQPMTLATAAAGGNMGYGGSSATGKQLSHSPQSVFSLPGSPDTGAGSRAGCSSTLDKSAGGCSGSSTHGPMTCAAPPLPCLPAVCVLGYTLTSLRDITLWRCGWHPEEEVRGGRTSRGGW